jgi:hypothetical protein
MNSSKCLAVFVLIFVLTSCSLVDAPKDHAPLRAEYAQKTADTTTGSLYTSTVLKVVGIGAASQAVPLFHLLGLIPDVGAVVYYLDELIYGTGAIVAREKGCPVLLEKQDYWNILGAWFKGIRTSAEFDAAMSLAATLTPLVTREKALQYFANAVSTHGAKLVGAKLAGVIAAKLTAKGLAGFLPVLGPVAAGGINWYIFSGVDDAANAYYQSKARVVCSVK